MAMRRGDSDAERELAARYFKLAGQIAREIPDPGESAEDLASECMVAFVWALQRYDVDRGDLRPYVRAAMKRSLISVNRRTGRQKRIPATRRTSIDDVETYTSPGDFVEGVLRSVDAGEALNRLAGRLRAEVVSSLRGEKAEYCLVQAFLLYTNRHLCLASLSTHSGQPSLFEPERELGDAVASFAAALESLVVETARGSTLPEAAETAGLDVNLAKRMLAGVRSLAYGGSMQEPAFGGVS